MQIQISETFNKNASISGITPKMVKEANMEFAYFLKDADIAQKNISLRQQQQELLDLGKSIISRMDISRIHEYATKLKKFLSDLTKGAYSYDEQEYRDGQGDTKYIATVKTIDRELKEMLDMQRNGQIKQINLVNKIIGIHGLILNIVI